MLERYFDMLFALSKKSFWAYQIVTSIVTLVVSVLICMIFALLFMGVSILIVNMLSS